MLLLPPRIKGINSIKYYSLFANHALCVVSASILEDYHLVAAHHLAGACREGLG